MYNALFCLIYANGSCLFCLLLQYKFYIILKCKQADLSVFLMLHLLFSLYLAQVEWSIVIYILQFAKCILLFTICMDSICILHFTVCMDWYHCLLVWFLCPNISSTMLYISASANSSLWSLWSLLLFSEISIFDLFFSFSYAFFSSFLYCLYL